MDELTKDVTTVIRGLLGLVKMQQDQITALFNSHFALLDALRNELQSSGPPVIDSKAIERANAEIRKLEELFELGADPRTAEDHNGGPRSITGLN